MAVTPTAIQRFESKVSADGSGCMQWTASRLPGGYGQFWDGFARVYAHRFAWEHANGTTPEGMFIDHMCHNRACVNVKHLRLVTPKQNNENTGTLSSINTSGYRGVSWSKHNSKWHAYIKHNGKRRHVGYFSDLEAANAAAIDARNKVFTHNDLDRAS